MKEEIYDQLGEGAARVAKAGAEDLPFDDGSFDAGLAVLTAHHWSDLEAGLRELRRVTRRRIVIVAFDPEALAELWIARDYFPEMLGLKRRAGATSGNLAALLPNASQLPPPGPARLRGPFFAALWARPEMLFDEEIVRPMWVWQQISEEAQRTGRERLAADLESGAWEERYGELRERSELDVGLRLVVSDLSQSLGPPGSHPRR